MSSDHFTPDMGPACMGPAYHKGVPCSLGVLGITILISSNFLLGGREMAGISERKSSKRQKTMATLSM